MDGWKEGPVNPAGPADECAWRTPYICKEKEHYRPDLTDGIFAIIAFIIGYLFARWVFFSWKGWGVAGFTTLYCAAVTAYMGIKGAPMKREGIFWLIVTWLTGLSFALWSGRSLEAVRSLFLLSTAVYAPIGLNGTSIEGKTGNMLILDGLNAVFVIPFRNFLNQYQSLRVFKGEKKSRISGQLSVLLGVGISLLGLFVLVPLLRSADSGGFSRILDSVFRVFSFSNKAVLKWFFYLLLSIPMAAYIYGLLSGCVHKKGWNTFKKEAAIDTVNALRIVPKGTILTVLGILCGVYLTFLLSQTPYFFSGFSGKRPEGWLVYSEYARRGFFELCQIAAINLGVLAAANLLSVNHRNAWKALKVFNVVLMLMTLLFIATAFSKMALYIHAYGLSMPRLLPCVFMAFMAIVCCGVILLQKWTFSHCVRSGRSCCAVQYRKISQWIPTRIRHGNFISGRACGCGSGAGRLCGDRRRGTEGKFDHIFQGPAVSCGAGPRRPRI
jgi:hypothetical protein